MVQTVVPSVSFPFLDDDDDNEIKKIAHTKVTVAVNQIRKLSVPGAILHVYHKETKNSNRCKSLNLQLCKSFNFYVFYFL